MITSEDIAEEIRTSFPGTEEIVVQYLSGYLLDDAGEDEDVLQVARMILESISGGNIEILEGLMTKLADLLEDLLSKREQDRNRGTGLLKLERAMEIGKTASMSGTIAMSQGVDLESINKGKSVGRDMSYVRMFFIFSLELPGWI
jgi:ATP-binding cassette subfamily F protein 3